MRQSDYNEMTIRHGEQLKRLDELPAQLDRLQALTAELNTAIEISKWLPEQVKSQGASIQDLMASRNKVTGMVIIVGGIVGALTLAAAACEAVGSWFHR